MTSAQVDDKPNSLAHDNKNWLRELRRARYTTSKTAQKIHNPSPRQPRMAVASRECPREQKNSAERGFLQGRNWHNRQRRDESAASHAETLDALVALSGSNRTVFCAQEVENWPGSELTQNSEQESTPASISFAGYVLLSHLRS